MPSTALTVDGSARTFTCVEVIPSTGTTVGVGGDGRGDSIGGVVGVGDRVAVKINGVGEDVAIWLAFAAQLLIIRATRPSEIDLKTTE